MKKENHGIILRQLLGDIIWEEYKSGSHHVYVYLGNEQKVACSSGHKDGEGVNIGSVHKVNSQKKILRKIIRIKDFEYLDLNSSIDITKTYFDTDTGKIIYEGKEVETSYVATDGGREQTNSNAQNTNNNTSTTTNESTSITQDETLMTIDFANIKCAGEPRFKKSAHGDLVMIGSDGHYLMIDTSENDLRDSFIKFMEDKNYKDKEFDIMISHDHEDHWGNAIYAMENYKVGTLYLPNKTSWMYSKLEKKAKQQGIKVVKIEKGDSFNIGKAKVEVLYNPNNKKRFDLGESDTNNRSLVTRISVQTIDGKEIRYLTCGDIQAGLEKELLKEGIDVKADIFKFSHHCMKTSNTKEFIDAVQPKYSVSNWWQDNAEQFPRTESTLRVVRAAKYGIVYSVVYNDGVKFSVSAHGVITPEIYRNVENIPYIIQDNQGNTISTFNLQIPRDAKVDSYKNLKRELSLEQQQAIARQITDCKVVGDMIQKGNTTVPQTNNTQTMNSNNGTKRIVVNIDINNLQRANGNETRKISSSGESLVNPKGIPDIATRVAEQSTDSRRYSMVIPKREVKAVKCDEYGKYDSENKEYYTFQAGKMYPGYYGTYRNENGDLVDYANINYRVLKSIDENGNEVYGLVNNGDLLKTVRLAKTYRNTHIITADGVSYDLSAFKDVLLIGNTAIVKNVLQYGDTFSGTIQSSDLIIDNNRWEEVITDNTREINMYSFTYNGKQKEAWGIRKGNKVTVYDVDLIGYDTDETSSTYKQFVGKEFRANKDQNINDFMKIIGRAEGTQGNSVSRE